MKTVLSNRGSYTLAILFFLISLALTFSNASAQVNLSGQWTATVNITGSNPDGFDFTLQQDGTVVTGIKPGDSNQGIILGSVTGNIFTFRIGFNDLGYSYDVTSTTDGNSISGTIIDSNSNTGTFGAVRIGEAAPTTPTLVPSTKITQPPVVSVTKDDVKLTLQKFKNPIFKRLRADLRKAALPKGSYEYVVTIKGAEKRKITSKKNVVTIKNLKGGNYNASYKVVALKDGKTNFSTKASPAVSFSIAK